MQTTCLRKCLREFCFASVSTENSAEHTPASRSASAQQPSPTFDLSREFMLALQSPSYTEIWSRFHVHDPNQEERIEIQQHNADHRELTLSEVLQPNRQCVEEALSHLKPSTLTCLMSSYFNHSENAISLCVNVYQSLHRALELYKPLCDLLDCLPHDPNAITESQCNRAFDIFIQFDSSVNPFPSLYFHNYHEMQDSISQLMQQLNHRLCISRSRVRRLHHATLGSAICLIAAVLGVAAVFIASHALLSLVLVGPVCSAYLPINFKKRELVYISQLDAVYKATFVVKHELDTLSLRVDSLHNAIEEDKSYIRLGLGRGRNICPVKEMLKELRREHFSFIEKLNDLEVHIFLFFNNINRARSRLLQEINPSSEL